MDEEDKAVELAKQRQRNIKRRKEMNEEIKVIEMAKQRERNRTRRENIDQEQKNEALLKQREDYKKRKGAMNLKEQKSYRMTVSSRRAKLRTKTFKKMNASKFMRRHIFAEIVKDGPIFPCISCHRLLYNNSVITIMKLEEFKMKVNSITENLFEEVIGKNLEKIPVLGRRYYLCITCKNYIFKGKMAPMSNQNNLDTFDYSKYPELRLTELETSMIAKNILFAVICQEL